MDSAEHEALRQAVSVQGTHLNHLDAVLQEVTEKLAQVTSALAALGSAPVQPPPSQLNPQLATPSSYASAIGHEPHIPPPAKYSGDPNTCRQFLTQCQLTFNAQPSRYANETARVAYLVNLLEGPPLSHFNALYEQNSPLAMSADAFASELRRVYDHPIRGQQAGLQLSRLQQGRLSVREFVSRFQSLAVESGWNEAALITAFQNGLNRDLGREIALRGELATLDETISLTIKINDQLSLLRAESTAFSRRHVEQLSPPSSVPDMPSNSGSESMQIDSVHLSPEGRARRIKTQSCLYCGQTGHFIANCPIRPVKGRARQ